MSWIALAPPLQTLGDPVDPATTTSVDLVAFIIPASIFVVWSLACLICGLKGRSSSAILLGPLGPLWVVVGAMVAGVIALIGWPAESPQDPMAELEPAAVGGMVGAGLVGAALVLGAIVLALLPATRTSWWAARRGG